MEEAILLYTKINAGEISELDVQSILDVLQDVRHIFIWLKTTYKNLLLIIGKKVKDLFLTLKKITFNHKQKFA